MENLIFYTTNNSNLPRVLQDLQRITTQKMKFSINPFVPNAPFLCPLKTSYGFLMSSGGSERVLWEQMGSEFF